VDPIASLTLRVTVSVSNDNPKRKRGLNYGMFEGLADASGYDFISRLGYENKPRLGLFGRDLDFLDSN
jgi:hypothetical protein